MVTIIKLFKYGTHHNFNYGKPKYFFPKVVFIFQIWTFIFVHFENPNLLFEFFISKNSLFQLFNLKNKIKNITKIKIVCNSGIIGCIRDQNPVFLIPIVYGDCEYPAKCPIPVIKK